MGFTLDVSISAVTVFLQGLLSFFSPCVLPLLPLYIGYLSGGTAVKGEDGRMHYKQSKVLLHTVFFVTGVSFAFSCWGLACPQWVDFSTAIRPCLHGPEVSLSCCLACIRWEYLEYLPFWEKSTACPSGWIVLPCRRLQCCLWALLSALPGRPA